MRDKSIPPEARLPIGQTIPLSLQHLFAMFGSAVLVPILFKVNPATVLLFNGIGTLIYLVLCKGKIPAYLGSSFAFLSPVFLVLSKYSYEAALGGFIVVGMIFCLVAMIVRAVGTKWIDYIFPPAAMGAIVAVIGLELMPTAAGMAGLTAEKPDPTAILVSILTLAITVFSSVAFSGLLAICRSSSASSAAISSPRSRGSWTGRRLPPPLGSRCRPFTRRISISTRF